MRIVLRIPKRQVRVAAAASVVVALGAGAGVAAQTDSRLVGGGSSAPEALTVPALPREPTPEFEQHPFEQHPEERLKGGAAKPVATEPVAVLAIAEALEDPQGPPPEAERGQQAEQGEAAQAQAPPPPVAQDSYQVSPEERAALALVEQILREREDVLMASGYDYVAAGRRDPFASLLVQTGAVMAPSVRPVGVAGFLVSEVELKGIATANGRWHAMVVGANRRAYFIEVGTDLPCALRGAEEILETLGRELGVEENQMTPEGRCSYVHFECLGACEMAPMMMVDDDYHGPLTPTGVRRLLEELE